MNRTQTMKMKKLFMNVIHGFTNLSLMHKLLMTFLLFGILPMLAVNVWISFSQISQQQKLISENADVYADQISQSVNVYFQNIDRIAKAPLYEDELQKKLEQIVPEKYKPDFALALVLLGRYICTARKVNCEKCPTYDVCLSKEKK